MHHGKYDPSMEKLKPGTKVGIVGESHVWDGPLGQEGREHGPGASNGSKGMKLKLGKVPYTAGPISSIAQG